MNRAPTSIGLPMLIVVFMSICIFSFSGIAFSIASSSMKLSSQMGERVMNYQDACNKAEIALANLEEIPKEETTYSFPFGVSMENLEVTIEPDDSERGYRIIRWCIAETTGWEAPESAAEKGESTVEGGNQGGPQGPVAPGGE